MPDILSKEAEFNIHRICQRDGLSFSQNKSNLANKNARV